MDDFGMGYALGSESGNNNDGAFGMGNNGIIWLVLILLLFGGGVGFGGNRGALGAAELQSSFNFNDLQNAVRGVERGICDSTYALNNAINGGFHGVDNALCAGFNGVNAALSVLMSALLTGCMHGVNLMLISYVPAFFKKTGRVSLVSGMLNSCTYIGSAVSVYGFAAISESAGWTATVFLWLIVAVAGTAVCLMTSPFWKKFVSKNNEE